MNEEQAVLDFFAQQENLPLALLVAEQVDALRIRMNGDFWRELGGHAEHLAPAWQVQLTEDRNTEECLVGLYLQPMTEQALFLRPMLEQQTIGGAPRIYFGLMWSAQPAPEQLALQEVTILQEALRHDGFRSNEKFLAWQWSPYYPRDRKFLLRFANAREALLNEASNLLNQLIVTHAPLLQAANAALGKTPRRTIVTLDALRNNLKRP